MRKELAFSWGKDKHETVASRFSKHRKGPNRDFSKTFRKIYATSQLLYAYEATKYEAVWECDPILRPIWLEATVANAVQTQDKLLKAG